MSETTFTLGPLMVECVRDEDGVPYWWAVVQTTEHQLQLGQAYLQEDANLWAAAPELLDEGSNALTVLRRLRTEGPSAISFINLDGAIFGLEAALAKARGVVVS